MKYLPYQSCRWHDSSPKGGAGGAAYFDSLDRLRETGGGFYIRQRREN